MRIAAFVAAGFLAVAGDGLAVVNTVQPVSAVGQADFKQETTLQPPADDCLLTPPANPLSAQGLATPWQLSGSTGGTPCTEEDGNTAVFVEATILDTHTGKLSAYDPLVVDAGTQPLVKPVVPTLPRQAAVAIWVGANTDVVLPGGVRGCSDGVDSVFSQQAYCGVPDFVQAVNKGLRQHRIAVPPIGTAKDGQPCPTSRSFSVVDQDQSDNDETHYLIVSNQVAQDTTANRAQFPSAAVASNGSDEGTVVPALDAALGCTPWKVTDLGDPQQTIGTGLLNEIQASRFQAAPVATVPAGDDFVVNPAPAGAQDLNKLNLYRQEVDQPPVPSLTVSSSGPVSASTTTYCQNLLHVGLPRIAGDQALLQSQPSPFPAVASNLFTFLAIRFMATFQDQPAFLHCTALLGVQNPVTVTTDANGVASSAAINLQPGPLAAASPTPSPSPDRALKRDPGRRDGRS